MADNELSYVHQEEEVLTFIKFGFYILNVQER